MLIMKKSKRIEKDTIILIMNSLKRTKPLKAVKVYILLLEYSISFHIHEYFVIVSPSGFCNNEVERKSNKTKNREKKTNESEKREAKREKKRVEREERVERETEKEKREEETNQ